MAEPVTAGPARVMTRLETVSIRVNRVEESYREVLDAVICPWGFAEAAGVRSPERGAIEA